MYSVCEHGPTPTLVNELQPLLQKYGAHFISGHDHCMEHLVDTQAGENGSPPVNYYVTGMGKECCYDASNMNAVPEGTLKWYIANGNKPKGVDAGFSSIVVDENGMTVTFYDQVRNLSLERDFTLC